MQKNYRDFTVGEILDLGLEIEIKKYGLQTVNKGKEITKMFEDTKQSTKRVTNNLLTVNAWKNNFRVSVYVPSE